MEKVKILYQALSKMIQIRIYETSIAEDFAKIRFGHFFI